MIFFEGKKKKGSYGRHNNKTVLREPFILVGDMVSIKKHIQERKKEVFI